MNGIDSNTNRIQLSLNRGYLASPLTHSQSHRSPRNQSRHPRSLAGHIGHRVYQRYARGDADETVFPSSEIPHLWFHRTQDGARNSNGSLYFENETIYSYGSHFPIARHATNKSKRKHAIVFTTQTHSVTTTAHCSHVRGAIPDTVQIFRVPNVIVSADTQASVPPRTKFSIATSRGSMPLSSHRLAAAPHRQRKVITPKPSI